MAMPAKLTVADTVPRSFVLSCETRGGATAMREKDHGIWKAITWIDWLERAKACAYALHASGFRPGDVASVLANTIVEWNYADMGILCAGGVSSGIYPTDSAAQVEYLINDSKTKILFVEDDEQLDKALEIRERCPTLERIVIFDMDGLRDFSDPMCVSFDAFLQEGRQYMRDREGLWLEMVDSRKPEDLAILVYTSGTTGPPKGAMHSHRGVCFQMKNCMSMDSLTFCEGDERLAFLPMCHVAERIAGAYYAIATGVVINFAESPETVPDNIREVQPTLFGAVPRVWEKFYAGTMIALKDATGFQRWVYDRAIKVGYRIADARIEGRTPSVWDRAMFQLGYWAGLRNVRKMMGLDRCRWLFTGAAPISPDLIRW
jgi:long-chain acyl-CoA synthetase